MTEQWRQGENLETAKRMIVMCDVCGTTDSISKQLLEQNPNPQIVCSSCGNGRMKPIAKLEALNRLGPLLQSLQRKRMN